MIIIIVSLADQCSFSDRLRNQASSTAKGRERLRKFSEHMQKASIRSPFRGDDNIYPCLIPMMISSGEQLELKIKNLGTGSNTGAIYRYFGACCQEARQSANNPPTSSDLLTKKTQDFLQCTGSKSKAKEMGTQGGGRLDVRHYPPKPEAIPMCGESLFFSNSQGMPVVTLAESEADS